MAKAFGLSLEDLDNINRDQMLKENIENLKGLKGVEGLADALHTSLTEGIPQADIDENFTTRREVFGDNIHPDPPLNGFWTLFIASLDDKTLIVLMSAAAVSLLIGVIQDPCNSIITDVPCSLLYLINIINCVWI